MSEYSIKIPFPLGGLLWAIDNGYRQEKVPCTECAGTLAITMVQGNGEKFSLKCECCGPGYGQATGYMTVHRFDHKPYAFTPYRVKVDGDQFYYSEAPPDATCYSSVSSKNLFATYDEAVVECEKRNVERREEFRRREIANLSSKRKSLAFSVHYWQERLRKAEREVEVIRERLHVSKEKSKP